MHPGVWVGENFKDTVKKVLILGESHYGDKDELGRVNYTTKEVVEAYVGNYRHKFFTGIAKSFGYESTEIREFYEQVCFGNYVNVSVEKDDEKNGTYFIDRYSNIYNKELFDFCVNNSVDIVVCFSMKTYNNLPPEGENKGEYVIERKESKIVMRKWLYKKGTLGNSSMILDKDLLVYGFNHPSDGRRYNAKLVYNEYIKKQPELEWLCKKSTI